MILELIFPVAHRKNDFWTLVEVPAAASAVADLDFAPQPSLGYPRMMGESPAQMFVELVIVMFLWAILMTSLDDGG